MLTLKAHGAVEMKDQDIAQGNKVGKLGKGRGLLVVSTDRGSGAK